MLWMQYLFPTLPSEDRNVLVDARGRLIFCGREAAFEKPIFSNNSTAELTVSFLGAVLDTGAAHSGIGINQAIVYAEAMGFVSEIRLSYTFKFGNICHPSHGAITISLPPSDCGGILLEVDFVYAAVPLLLCLNTLDEQRMLANTGENMGGWPHLGSLAF